MSDVVFWCASRARRSSLRGRLPTTLPRDKAVRRFADAKQSMLQAQSRGLHVPECHTLSTDSPHALTTHKHQITGSIHIRHADEPRAESPSTFFFSLRHFRGKLTTVIFISREDH